MKLKLLILLSLIPLLLIGPFFIPIPELEDQVEKRDLKDQDSLFVNIEGIDIHYKDTGQREDTEKTYILLHGFGSSTYTWEKIKGELAQDARVISYDRPGFGLTERPTTWNTFNPYTPEAQRDIVIELMNSLEIDEAILMGHSAGGLVALNTYLEYPEKISQLVLIAPAIYEVNIATQYLRPLLNIPQVDRLGPLFVRRIGRRGEDMLKRTWFDESKITEEDIQAYKEPLNIIGWDRALWNLTKYTYSLKPEESLGEIEIPVLIITGDTDTVVVPENSIRLYEEIPTAKIEIVQQCGHVPQEECPQEVLDILENM